MIARNRFRLLHLFLIAMFVLAGLAIPLAILFTRSYTQRQAALSRQQAAVSRQQAAVDVIRRHGGFVVFRPISKSALPDVISVDLSNAIVDAELLQTVGQFSGIERLTLDGAKLQPEEYSQFCKLPKLQTLSLTQSNVTDASVSRLPLGLTSLSLNGTAVTDESMSRLSEMQGLVSLNITNTGITPDGLRLLQPLRSLKNLWVDDSCITAESVEALRLMQPQNIDVTVSEGIGKGTYELLSVCKGLKITGHHRDGYVLWSVDSAWTHTFAGVVEAVVSEIGLDSEQETNLVKALMALGDQERWGPTVPDPPASPRAYWISTDLPDRRIEFASVDEFIGGGLNFWAIRRFVREKFTSADVPKLLAAIRAAQYPTQRGLFYYGPFLLIRHGIDDPEVLAELDRLLAHEQFFVRVNTVCSFGFGGAEQYYSREEWTASEAADAFAVPRLQRICYDDGEAYRVRNAARMVLVEIAHRRPEYSAEVIRVLVDLLEVGWHARADLPRLAEVNTDAAIAMVPRLREMLKKLDEQLASAPTASLEGSNSPKLVHHGRRLPVLEALAAIAHHHPVLAHEIALDYLSRMENGQSVPFAPLLSPDTPETNQIVVRALLRNASVAKEELASIARKIRDWRTTKERMDE
jgi:hypothetical protein